MRVCVINKLVCPVCDHYPFNSEVFDSTDDSEIIDGVIWCEKCGSWFPIEDSLLELLSGGLEYTEDRALFWNSHSVVLEELGLDKNHRLSLDREDTLEEKKKQQNHFDWYADNSEQSYEEYEQLSFWKAVDEITFDNWKKGLVSGGWLLEIGCGAGRCFIQLKDKDLQLVGFDISKAMIRGAIDRNRIVAQENRSVLFVADATKLPFISSSFDYVLGYGVLHHLPNPGEVCKEVGKVLKQGGVFFNSENNKTIFRWGFDLMQRLIPLWHEEAGEQHMISDADYRVWFRRAGLKYRSSHTSVFLPPHIFKLFSLESARWLINISDRMFRMLPFIKKNGGLIIVEAVKE